MKSRIIWATVLLAAAVGFYFATIRPSLYHSPGFSTKRPPVRNFQPPEIAPPVLPVPVMATPAIPLPSPAVAIRTPPVVPRREGRVPMKSEVPIQDNATIDFSIGAPVVRSGGHDQEVLDRALKEMAEATKNTRFPPTKE